MTWKNNLPKDNSVDNLTEQINSLRATIADTSKLERLSINALNQLKYESLQKELNIKLNNINRIKEAELQAELEIQKARESYSEKLTELEKQRVLMSKEQFKQYAAQMIQSAALQKRIDANNRVMEAAIERGITDLNSKQGRSLQKELAFENRQAYVQETLATLKSSNVRAKYRAVAGMLGGTRVADDGTAHNLVTDTVAYQQVLKDNEAKEAAILKKNPKTTKEDLERTQEAAVKNRNAQARLSDLQEQWANASTEKEQAKIQKQIDKASKEAEESADVLKAVLEETGLSKVADQLVEMQDAEDKANEEVNASLYESAAKTTAVMADLASSLEGTMDEIASYKSGIDTRLYGSGNDTLYGSYWRQISYDLSSLMISPLVKQEDVMKSVVTVVEKGIAKDVEQIAMLDVIKDKIATTFNVFDGSMRRLIRIQDENTTAARLGMEASLNELLNEMYETTEYLSDLASSIRSSITEAEALMSADEAVEFEYQVQKWLGSLYSVGMSDSGVSSIATALGQLASGNIEGITSGGVGNLLVMAANNAGLSISEILANGLDDSQTNLLLQEMVEYMAELVEESGNSLVVQQQLASVYGLTASDLKAATNLTSSYSGKSNIASTLAGYTGSYSSMIGNLFDMADLMYSRTSTGELLSNIWSNVQYSTAAGMASNPITYLTMKVADILDTFAGGIDIPYVTVMGSGVDTGLTVSNIMKTASMVGGFTQSLISMLSNLGTGAGITGASLLNIVGLTDTGTSVTRGTSTSSSGTGTIYNGSYEDMESSATQQANDESSETMASAQESSTEVTTTTINENIVNIYNLLQGVVDGTSSFNVSLNGQYSSMGSSWN